MKEIDMYKPLKKFLKEQGYTVHSEVESVDVMARKGDELLIVEMKTTFNLQLIYQLIERLKITDQVYAYIPLGKGGRWPKWYKRMCALLKRLQCGLLTLDQHTRKQVVLEFKPAAFTPRKNYTKKNLALKEFTGRSIDLNQGGSTRELLFTAYKEKAIRIAMYLFEQGASSTRDIKKNLEIAAAVDILNKNYQGWFERASRGVYALTPEFEFFRLKYQKKIEQLWRRQSLAGKAGNVTLTGTEISNLSNHA
jgi:hypothetical protein